MQLSLECALNVDDIGLEMHSLIGELYPICRSITGDGVRQTLHIINRRVPITIHEIPTGSEVFDWSVPKEWNIRDAYVKNATGERVIDFRNSNLHVVSYSVPVHARMPLTELKNHLHTFPENEDWIPYRTSYYSEDWGFCLSGRQLSELKEGEYEVFIDSTLEDGTLTYGEYYQRGELEDEILFSCHICHPSLCNDNLSGISLLTYLAEYLATQKTKYSYRFLFIPGTIGAITWLALNEKRVQLIKHGLVVTCVGDPGSFHYKKSRQGNAKIDRVAEYALTQSGTMFDIMAFSPYGYDERQFCSPDFDLPVGRLTRSSHEQYAEYHTSADNMDLVEPTALAESLNVYLRIIHILENERTYINKNPKCEPQLGRRGLYHALGGTSDTAEREMAMLWILNLSDGRNSLLDIAMESKLSFELLVEVAKTLQEHDLLAEADA